MTPSPDQETARDTPMPVERQQSHPIIPGYEVLEVLGQGGMGTVFKARDLILNRCVALKMVRGIDDEVLTRFDEEVRTLAGLRHSNIAQVYETGRAQGQPYFNMELLGGGSLSDRLKDGPLPPRESAAIVAQVARAVQFAHEAGIIHRDLKPANILLDTAETSLEAGQNAKRASKATPKVVDFGIAKRVQSDLGLTRTGDILGTPCYMAPEQASGVVTKLGPAADVYALGAILFEGLTGRPPFLGPDAVNTLMMVLTMDVPSPHQLQPGLPRDLVTICLKCLEKSAKKRYPSAEALADDLERYLDGLPILARPALPWECFAKWAKRKPWRAAASGLGLLLLAGLVAGFFVLQQAYSDVTDSNRVADESYRLTQAALHDIVRRQGDELWNVPGAERQMLATYQQAADLSGRLLELRPGDRQTLRDYADVLAHWFMYQMLYKRFDDARKTLDRRDEVLRQAQTTLGDDLDLSILLVRADLDREWLARRSNQVEAMTASRQRIDARLVPLLERYPIDLRLLRLNYEVIRGRASDAMSEGKFSEALAGFRSALVLAQQVFAASQSGDDATKVLGARKSLATLLKVGGHFDEADSLFQQIERDMPQLPLDERGRLALRCSILTARGEIALRRDLSLAAQLLASANDAADELVTRNPLDVEYRIQGLEVRYALSELERKRGRDKEADMLLDDVISRGERIRKEHPEYQTIVDMLELYRRRRDR
jgi:serine/threonine protein kinase